MSWALQPAIHHPQQTFKIGSDIVSKSTGSKHSKILKSYNTELNNIYLYCKLRASPGPAGLA